MLYEAKEKAYEYIKGILDAEEKEYQAYMKRVEEAVGFEFEKWQGYQPNRSLLREYEITAIWIPSERFDTLDEKVWRKIDSRMFEDGHYVAIKPNKRYKQGKAIAAVLSSYKAVTDNNHRRNGVAQRLLQLAEQQAKLNGVKTIGLEYFEDESDRFVLDWYLRSGYKLFNKKSNLLIKKLED